MCIKKTLSFDRFEGEPEKQISLKIGNGTRRLKLWAQLFRARPDSELPSILLQERPLGRSSKLVKVENSS